MNDKENIMQGSTKYIALILALMLGGCVSTTPKLDEHFGEAVNAAKAQQTINPDASMDTDPVAGIDGVSANAAIENYQKSGEKPAKSVPAFTLGTGAGK